MIYKQADFAGLSINGVNISDTDCPLFGAATAPHCDETSETVRALIYADFRVRVFLRICLFIMIIDQICCGRKACKTRMCCIFHLLETKCSVY